MKKVSLGMTVGSLEAGGVRALSIGEARAAARGGQLPAAAAGDSIRRGKHEDVHCTAMPNFNFKLISAYSNVKRL